MLRVAILMTVHNRRETTLRCLENCWHQIDAGKNEGKYAYTVYLVDDGSTDGTSEAVRETFPQTILIKGDGNLYWNQGMWLAWDRAAAEDFDFYLWLNDDTLMNEGTLAALMENSEFLRHKAIIVGTTANSAGEITYGGRNKARRLMTPDPVIPIPCHLFNGNLVLVPRSVYLVLGNLDPVYHHTFGDFDYGVRAHKQGIDCVIAPGIAAVCNRDHGLEKWRDAAYPLKERWHYLHTPKGRPPKEQFIYDYRESGLLWAVVHGISIHFKVLFPTRKNNG